MQMKLKRIVTQTEEKSEIYNGTCIICSQEFSQLLNSAFTFILPDINCEAPQRRLTVYGYDDSSLPSFLYIAR